MTVKEVEERTGLTRANIRYYESEGLISPGRGENGYRDYSGEEVDTLLKIKLLRQLGFSLEEIRQLQAGALELEPALEGRLEALQAEQEERAQAAGVCRAMRENHVRYDTLDACAYLNRMEEPERPALTWREDLPPKPASPWRRYLARTVDLYVCWCLWSLILAVGLREVAAWHEGLREVLDTGMSAVILLLTEPLWLHFLGATPGKFLFGLRLTRSDGSYLSYGEGLRRTLGVLAVGMGFRLWPLLEAVLAGWALWRVYHDEPLFWEAGDQAYSDGSRPGASYWGRRSSFLKLAGAGALCGLCVAASTLGAQYALSPVHREANLTVSHFVENYNQFTQTLAGPGEPIERLTPEGAFLEAELPPNTFVLELTEDLPLQLRFRQEDGVLTQVSYSCSQDGREGLLSLPAEKTARILWAFLEGRCALSRKELLRMMDQIETQPDQPLVWEGDGAAVSYRPQVEGYFQTPLGWEREEGAEDYRFSVEFAVSLEEKAK